MQHWVLEYYQVCSNYDPGLTMTCFTARSNLVPYAFVWGKGKTMDFSETDLKLATDDRSDKKFLLTYKLCPHWAVCPLPRGYMHVLKYEKICIKSDFKEICLKLATNDRSDKMFLFTSKFHHQGAVCPCPGATCIYMHWIMNFFIKSDFKEIFFIPPAKHSFSGVYCFQHVCHSVIPWFHNSVNI